MPRLPAVVAAHQHLCGSSQSVSDRAFLSDSVSTCRVSDVIWLTCCCLWLFSESNMVSDCTLNTFTTAVFLLPLPPPPHSVYKEKEGLCPQSVPLTGLKGDIITVRCSSKHHLKLFVIFNK